MSTTDIYYCEPCAAHIERPSWSDASVEYQHPDSGQWVHDHAHIPICPRCFKQVKLLKWASRKEES